MVDAVEVPVGLPEVRLHREGAPDLHKVNVFSEIRDCNLLEQNCVSFRRNIQGDKDEW